MLTFRRFFDFLHIFIHFENYLCFWKRNACMIVSNDSIFLIFFFFVFSLIEILCKMILLWVLTIHISVVFLFCALFHYRIITCKRNNGCTQVCQHTVYILFAFLFLFVRACFLFCLFRNEYQYITICQCKSTLSCFFW